ncbi:MAG: MFS transporter [Bacteroidota bacterium]
MSTSTTKSADEQKAQPPAASSGSPNDISLAIKLTILLCSSLTVMAGAIVAPALAKMKDSFADVDNIELLSRLTLTLPALFIGVFSPLMGWLLDRVGRMPVLIGGLVIYAIVGAGGGFLPTIEWILVSRAALGLAVAGIMTSVTTLAADYMGGVERQKFIGIQSAVMALGGVIYITIGGLLAELDWRYVFLVYAASLLFLPLVLIHLYEPRNTYTPEVDADGNVLEVKTPPAVWLTFALGLFGMIVFYITPVQTSFYLKQDFDIYDSRLAGAAIASSTFMTAFMGFVFQKIRSHISPYAITAITFVFIAVGYTIVAQAAEYWQVVTGLAINGIGIGLLMPNVSIWLIEIAPEKIRGRLIAGLTSAFFIGQFLSPLIANPIREAQGVGATFQWAAVAAGVVALLFVVWSLLRRGR